jgi:PIN domain nuclease of toxin-antitoxin system
MLLDSQAVLWVLTGSDRLGPGSRQLIESSTAHVSAASVWELTIKSMLGKLDLPSGLPGVLEDEGFVLLAVGAVHAEAIREFPELARHDPFDRLLVAQAHVERMSLVTADRVLLGLNKDFLVDATA